MALNRTKKDGADAKSSLQHIRLQGNIAPHVKQINDGLYKETAVYHYPHKTGLFFIQIDRVAIRTNILHIFGYLAKPRPNCSHSGSTSSSSSLDTALEVAQKLPPSLRQQISDQ